MSQQTEPDIVQMFKQREKHYQKMGFSKEESILLVDVETEIVGAYSVRSRSELKAVRDSFTDKQIDTTELKARIKQLLAADLRYRREDLARSLQDLDEARTLLSKQLLKEPSC